MKQQLCEGSELGMDDIISYIIHSWVYQNICMSFLVSSAACISVEHLVLHRDFSLNIMQGISWMGMSSELANLLHVGCLVLFSLIWHRGEISTIQNSLYSYCSRREGCLLSFISCYYDIRRLSQCYRLKHGYIFIYSLYESCNFYGPLWNTQEGTITVHYYVTHVVPCNGRRDYRGSDLRAKLGKRHYPIQRYSSGRHARGRRKSEGYSPPRSLGKRSDKKHRKKQLDGQSDFSGSLKFSDGTEDQVDQVKDKRTTSSDSKDVLDEQLRQVQTDIEMLEDHKNQLETYLGERIQEADSLTSRIQELEMQLSNEKEECKRITSKIKKFVKAHNRHSGIQDELKRSQARLQKLGDQLGSDATRPGANEEDASINILSDGETFGNHVLSPQNELQKNPSASKKRQRIHLMEADEELKEANPTKGEDLMKGTNRLDKLSRGDAHRAQVKNNNEAEADGNGSNGWRLLGNAEEPIRGKNIPSVDKVKGPESGPVLPSTSMAAHAVDEVVEMDGKFEVVGNAFARVEKGVAYEIPGLPLPLPPPPPIPKNIYLQYQGDDENVDVDGLEEEMVDVDIV